MDFRSFPASSSLAKPIASEPDEGGRLPPMPALVTPGRARTRSSKSRTNGARPPASKRVESTSWSRTVERAVRLKAGVGGQETRNRAREQPGADDEHHRQRDLERHERRAQAPSLPRGRAGPSDERRAVGARGVHRGRQARHERHDDGDCRAARQHGQIHAHGVEPRQLARAEPREHAHGGHREGDTERRAGGRDDRALGERAAHETPAAGAERQAHRQLAPARQRSRDEQHGHVGARDGEHQNRRHGERREHRAQGARQVVGQRDRRRAPQLRQTLPIAFVIELRLHPLRVVIELRERGAGAQAGHQVVVPRVGPPEDRHARHGLEPQPDVHAVARERQGPRRDARHDERPVADRQGAAEDRSPFGRLEVAGQALADDDVGERPAGHDGAPARHRYVEHLEEAVRHDPRVHDARLARPAHREALVGVGGHAVRRAQARDPLVEVPSGNDARVAGADEGQTFRGGVWQGAEQDAVGNGVDGGRQAGAQSECEHGYGGRPRRVAQAAGGLTQLEQQRGHVRFRHRTVRNGRLTAHAG